LKFVGFDISTSCSGYSIIDENENILDINYIKTDQDTWIDKAFFFRDSLNALTEEDVRMVAIEDIMSKFSSGMSSSKTIIALARFNALATFFCFEKWKMHPVHINVLRARNLAGIKIPKGVNAKQHILHTISIIYQKIEWPKKKRIDAISDIAYDMADSVVISLAAKRMYEKDIRGSK